MKKTIPVVRLSWKKFCELYEGKHEVEGRKYRYTQERIRKGVYTEIVNFRFNKETGEVERVQVRCCTERGHNNEGW